MIAMRLIALVWIALAPCAALAQPASQSDYKTGQITAPGQDDNIPSAMSNWCDESSSGLSGATAALIAQGCKPRPTSKSFPIPVSSKPNSATYAGANASAIVTANVAVTVFLAGIVVNGCDISNPVGNDPLYVDLTGATAVAGSGTAWQILPGQHFYCPFPPLASVSAVSDKPQSFIAVRY